MPPSNNIRTHAIFIGDNFYDWLTVASGQNERNSLQIEYHVHHLQGNQSLEQFLKGKTQKPITQLTPGDWMIIHVCEAKIIHENFPRAEAVGYITRLLKSHREKKLQYDLTDTLAQAIGGIGLMLIDSNSSDRDISLWFDQAILFATTAVSLRSKSEAIGINLINEVGAPDGWTVIHDFSQKAGE